MYCDDFAHGPSAPFIRADAAISPHKGSRAHLLALINDPDVGSVQQLCRETGLSQPRLLRLCRGEFGDTPKKLLRRARFGRMLNAMRHQPYDQWRDFIDPQYYDQSHFIRDFNYFLGIAPSGYLRLPAALQGACAAEFAQWEDPAPKIGTGMG